MTTVFMPARLVDRAAATAGRALIRWADRHAESETLDRDEQRRLFRTEQDRAARELAAARLLPFARR